MEGKRRTSFPRSPARKRKPRTKPVSPLAKGEAERLAVQRRDAMKYRLAGASYRLEGAGVSAAGGLSLSWL